MPNSMKPSVTISRETLRRMGGCSAVAYDRTPCCLRHGHAYDHEWRSGSTTWPDSERDDKLSAEAEARIWAGLLQGYHYQERDYGWSED